MQQHIARALVGGAAPAVAFGLLAGFIQVFAEGFAFDDEQARNEAIHIARAAVGTGYGVFAFVLVLAYAKAGEKSGGKEFFVSLFAAGVLPLVGKGSQAAADFVGGELVGGELHSG